MLSRCDAAHHPMTGCCVGKAVLQTCCKGSSNEQEVNMVKWEGLIDIVA